MKNIHTLPARVTLYQEIEDEYIESLEAQGIAFADKKEDAQKTKAFITQLASRGALVRNGGASVSLGNLSSACVACTGDKGSKTFILSLMCNRSCYFCFNPNQQGYKEQLTQVNDWRAELDAYEALGVEVSHIALTGGEPLLHKEDTLEFFRTVRKNNPGAHTRLYTTGDQLDTPLFEGLKDAGLTEIRFSIKMDDPIELVEKTLDAIAQAREYIPQVMVEMPVIPGTDEAMQTLLCALDELSIFGINLLEFCFPLNNWPEFEERGFAVKNPPFPVLYNYMYAGGLPVAGSEELSLELISFALDKGLQLGVHYCSLENKHRDEVYQLNTPYADSFELYSLDPNDFFLKTVLVFDEDVEALRSKLEEEGIPFNEDPEDAALQFNPKHLDEVKELDASPTFYISYNLVVPYNNEMALRELKIVSLEP